MPRFEIVCDFFFRQAKYVDKHFESEFRSTLRMKASHSFWFSFSFILWVSFTHLIMFKVYPKGINPKSYSRKAMKWIQKQKQMIRHHRILQLTCQLTLFIVTNYQINCQIFDWWCLTSHSKSCQTDLQLRNQRSWTSCDRFLIVFFQFKRKERKEQLNCFVNWNDICYYFASNRKCSHFNAICVYVI